MCFVGVHVFCGGRRGRQLETVLGLTFVSAEKESSSQEC